MIKKLQLLIVIPILLTNCAYAQTLDKKDYPAVEASICNTNQKVASHFLISGIPDGFNASQYKLAIDEVCRTNPACLSQAHTIFDNFRVEVRKLDDDVFSVMLCDKQKNFKIMEDLSCNSLKVEIQSWKNSENIKCEYDSNWKRVVQDNCE